jgi:SNF2 family DNA or RNA helicase
MAFVETDWNPSDIYQAIYRLYRTGQKKSVIAYFLTLAGSTDEYMLDTNVLKQKIIDNTLDKR